ncbi:MAG TPA: ROK family protein [Candidatus Cybelea sp.]|jgi:glucokinase|nr:ROK family protein [Candidatus Cybelea sp.]
MPIVAIDAGGTHLRFAVAGDDGALHSYERHPMPGFRSGKSREAIWDAVLDAIARYVRDVSRKRETGEAIVFSVPGPVVAGSRLLAAPTILGALGGPIPDLAGELQARTGRCVRLVNDVSAAAWYLAERIDARRFFVVTVSSGIGGKLFDSRHADGVLDTGFGGEIGHVVVDTSAGAPLCDCGARGHLGAISSGRGTEFLARRLARSQPGDFASSLVSRRFGAAPGAITNEQHLIPAALAGDAWALSAIEAAARPLAGVLAALVAAAGLDRIVVIGGFAHRLGRIYRNVLASTLCALLDSHAFPLFANGNLTLYDEIEDVCLAGAAAFYRARCGAVR